MSASHQFLKIVRQIHLYVGVFIAPALLFFAFTGGMQVFSLHETTRGSDYKPPSWLVTMAQLHKKQTMTVPMRKVRPIDIDSHQPTIAASPSSLVINPAPALQNRPEAPRIEASHPLPLKIYSAFVALGLLLSTLIGIYMAYRYTRKRVLVSVLLLAGVVLPIMLALI